MVIRWHHLFVQAPFNHVIIWFISKALSVREHKQTNQGFDLKTTISEGKRNFELQGFLYIIYTFDLKLAWWKAKIMVHVYPEGCSLWP